MQLIHEYRDSQAYVAMLCKTSVARKVFQELKRLQIGFKQCELLEFDARKVFAIDASACLLLIELDPEATSSPNSCTVYNWQPPQEPQRQYNCGYLNGRFYSQLPCDQEATTSAAAPYEFDGTCCLPWRQGIKHDCAALMELTLDAHGNFTNGLKEPVQVESEYIFPLVKGSHFKAPIKSKHTMACEIHVAHAAPSTPIPAKKINVGSRIIFTMSPAALMQKGTFVCPAALYIPVNAAERKMKGKAVVTICR